MSEAADGGSSAREAGGGAGPIVRRGAELEEEAEELRRYFGGGSCASSERLRLVWSWGGSLEPTGDIFKIAAIIISSIGSPQKCVNKLCKDSC